MKFLKRFLLVILLVVLAAIGIGYVLPESAHVERSVRIEAPPQAVFPYVNDFRNFNLWAPWAAMDPDIEYSFTGPETGIGSRMAWESDNPDVGSGSQLIVESKPSERVTTRLDFGARGTATAYFDIDPATGDASEVTWGFDAEFGNDIIGRYFGVMMERWVGGDYEQGLQNLKELVEKRQGGES